MIGSTYPAWKRTITYWPYVPRLWPYVLLGLVVAWLMLAMLPPIPSPPLTEAERIWLCQTDLHCESRLPVTR